MIPTGRGQTSWLFTGGLMSLARRDYLRQIPGRQIQRVVLGPGPSRLQRQRAKSLGHAR